MVPLALLDAWKLAAHAAAMSNDERTPRQIRAQLLLELYRATKGNSLVQVNLEDLGQHLGIPYDDVRAAYGYFYEHGLVKGAGAGLRVFITAHGVDVAEAAQDPAPVEPPAVVNIQADTVGAVQTGSHSSANVVQNIGSLPQDIAEAFATLREAADRLEAAKQAEAIELVEALQEQALAKAEGGAVKKALAQSYGVSLKQMPLVSSAVAVVDIVLRWLGVL